MAIRPSAAPANPCGDGLTDSAKIGREGEERAGNGLRGAIARKESVVAHPSGHYKRLAQQRQHHVTAAEYQRARGPCHVVGGLPFSDFSRSHR